ncbi:hypothetical protein MKZ26_04920 [Sporosarcina sp. FSL K6-6792]|uniref:hypothetical protein n=1 Tax=Sporosarcina sp. FSL K6-6792 TaxID=2921559 RepID=UPI0030FA1A76
MKRLVYRLFVMTVFLSMMIVSVSVSATSWIEMDPQEVSDEAEVVISGTYDFSSKPIDSEFIFQGYTFAVENVYKGEATKQIIAGIDMYDVGWAEGFQNEGGEFLLFLEKSDSATFLTPVGGPNGMVQVLHGIINNENEEIATYYADFLKTSYKNPSSGNNVALIDKENLDIFNPLYISVIALFAIAVLILLYRFARKGRR